MYQVMMTVASFEIVKDLPRNSYGLVFGVNTFIALGLETILTTIVNTWLSLDPRPQFEVYGLCYVIPLAVFVPFILLKCCR